MSEKKTLKQPGFLDAFDFGFSPEAYGIENAEALQHAIDQGGTIAVTRPGTYKIAATVYVGSNTTLIFGNNVFLKKVDEQGSFTHVLLNKGACTKTYDTNIVIEGLHIIINGIDVHKYRVYGLHGQIAFFYVKDLRIERFRCLDLGKAQYCIHICTFEDIIINDIIIKGKKDGVHLGRGKRFTISNGVFQTFDDAIALNAHDYLTGNPELGWIVDGVVEKCHDLNAETTSGFFCRILAGAWIKWRSGMEVQQSDSVVSNGKVYRVQARSDGTVYTSITQPVHEHGKQVLDGITWNLVQDDTTFSAGVRNITFRDIFLYKSRIGFSIHFDNNHYSRSYYPGARIPIQEKLTFDNVRIAHDKPDALLSIDTPVDVVTITHSSLKNNPICFRGDTVIQNCPKTVIAIIGCIFSHDGPMDVVINNGDPRDVLLKTSSNIELSDGFSAKVTPGNNRIKVESDLTGLKST